jgi:catalase
VGEVISYASHVTDEDFIQPAALWEVIGREPGHHDRCIGNIVAHLKGVKSHELRRAVYGVCSSSIIRGTQ